MGKRWIQRDGSLLGRRNRGDWSRRDCLFEVLLRLHRAMTLEKIEEGRGLVGFALCFVVDF